MAVTFCDQFSFGQPRELSRVSAPILPQDRLPKSDTATPRIGQNGPAQAKMIARQNADLLFQGVGEGTRTPGPQDHNLVL